MFTALIISRERVGTRSVFEKSVVVYYILNFFGWSACVSHNYGMCVPTCTY